MQKNWMEVILLRTSPENIEMLVEELPKKLNALLKTPELLSVAICVHGQYSSDMIIELRWDSLAPVERSREGLLMAEHLSQYGFINHSIWIDKFRSKRRVSMERVEGGAM